MKKLLFGAAASVISVAALSSAAYAECRVVNPEFEAKILDNPEMRAGYRAEMVRDMRQLRDAAHLLANYGKEDACQSVSDAVQDLVANPEKARDARRSEQTTSGGDAAQNWQEREIARYKQAKSINELSGNIRASDLIGADVRGVDNESLGELDDIVLGGEKGRSYAIVSHGGFLGLGDKQVAVPFDRLRLSGDGDVAYVNMTKAQMDQAPAFERGDYKQIREESWRKKNDEYYSKY